MGGEIISEIFNNYGMTGIVVFIVALVSFAVFLKYISTLSFKFPGLKRNKSPKIDFTLRDHLFFTNAKFKLRFDIPTLEITPDKPITQRMFIDLIYLNVESFYYGCKRLIEIYDLRLMSGQEWGNVTKDELQRMLKSYEEKAEDMGIPHIVVRKYARWMGTYIDMMNSYIEQLSGSTVYGDSVLRTNVFLLIMNLLIVTMMGDIDKLARDSSNDISGIEYRGSIVEDSRIL